jgi:hypothetical protein
MVAHPDETTNQAAAKLSRVLDSQPRHARRLPEHERAKRALDAAQSQLTDTHIALLLIYVPNLKPNIGIGKRTRRIAQDAVEAPQAFVIFGLLLVDDPQPEKNFIGLVEV